MARMQLLLVAVILTAPGKAACAVEEPKYQVVDVRMGFEMRRYAPTLVAETRVTGSWGKVGGEASNVLRGYIEGGNDRNEKIERTVPVLQAPERNGGAPPPVVSAPADEPKTYTFAFVMPSKYSMETLPKPNDARITLREVPGRLMAARRFRGVWSEDSIQRNEKVMLDSMELAGLRTAGSQVYARYDSGFTPWFTRRNEVLVELEEPAGR